MVTKAQKIRVGIFIAIGSLLILIFAGVVAGSKLFQKRDIYYIRYDDVSVAGLQVGGSVQYHGIKVGRVDAIRINPDNVSQIILTISVDHGTPIKEDVEATLIMVGITGLKSVELRGGTNEARLIKPGSYLKTGVSTMDNITDRAESIAEKIDLIAANIASMTSEENQKNIASILEQTNLLLIDTRTNLSETLHSLSVIAANASEITTATSSSLTKLTESTTLLMSDTRNQINTIGGHTDQLILNATKDLAMLTANINQSLTRINQIVSTPQFDSLIVNVNTISQKLSTADVKQLVTDLNKTVVQTTSLVGNLDRTVTRGRTDLLETLESLREAAENLNEFSKQISEDPSILLRGQ
jgi:phospholipid/cholesterol/gamma-HCH transport system substrate-binding protein